MKPQSVKTAGTQAKIGLIAKKIQREEMSRLEQEVKAEPAKMPDCSGISFDADIIRVKGGKYAARVVAMRGMPVVDRLTLPGMIEFRRDRLDDARRALCGALDQFVQAGASIRWNTEP